MNENNKIPQELNEATENLNISDVSENVNCLTLNEKIWVSKIIWFYENEKGFDKEDIINQKNIFSKLKIN